MSTLNEDLNLGDLKSEMFVKVFALGLLMGKTLYTTDCLYMGPQEFENVAKEKMYAAVGTEIPGTNEVFTRDMVDALILMWSNFGGTFLDFC
ncbi:MAG: hypothetical protein HGB12_17830 [Bacteroidetes bacterium]|nr:hypothetical protein [Bacteroidota bacterium]